MVSGSDAEPDLRTSPLPGEEKERHKNLPGLTHLTSGSNTEPDLRPGENRLLETWPSITSRGVDTGENVM